MAYTMRQSGAWQLRKRRLLGFVVLRLGVVPAFAARMQLMVTSEWANLQVRLHLRRAFRSCLQHVGEEHSVEQLFFMGDPRGTLAELEGAAQESEAFTDIVVLDGPDSDPPLSPAGSLDGARWTGGFLRVFDKPAAGAHRIAYGLLWLLVNRPDLEYVAHLLDSSYVHLPGLFAQIAEHANTSLALGVVAEAPLIVGHDSESILAEGGGWSTARHTAGDCETCEIDPEVERQCSAHGNGQQGTMDYRGCLSVAQDCCPSGDCGAWGSLEKCLAAAHTAGFEANEYFGSTWTPRWLRGMGWVLGRRLVEFIALNVEDLKMRGTPELLLGFWLASVEDVHFVHMHDGLFRKLPSHAAEVNATGPLCSVDTVVAHGMDHERWVRWFDAESCVLRCPNGGAAA
eukprot:gnl/TRDRNA2_/TRDRNA2_185172_c0_seq1.p1 gnl/TRDRNA2_/TRDRNA2_185172_c0~~gnl/TRDRNA2_/TRDRNA2_185172_c0_seq1.p1  ORF type:complete len:399 (+),score=66.86 gnl/TRDRNA2_/TRDRNA2_185172_c0_seq1:39-1235(+)